MKKLVTIQKVELVGRVKIKNEFLDAVGLKIEDKVSISLYKDNIIINQIEDTLVQESTQSPQKFFKIGSLGRITIPKEIREECNINLHDEIEVNLINNRIILRKYNENKTINKREIFNYIERLKEKL